MIGRMEDEKSRVRGRRGRECRGERKKLKGKRNGNRLVTVNNATMAVNERNQKRGNLLKRKPIWGRRGGVKRRASLTLITSSSSPFGRLYWKQMSVYIVHSAEGWRNFRIWRMGHAVSTRAKSIYTYRSGESARQARALYTLVQLTGCILVPEFRVVSAPLTFAFMLSFQ